MHASRRRILSMTTALLACHRSIGFSTTATRACYRLRDIRSNPTSCVRMSSSSSGPSSVCEGPESDSLLKVKEAGNLIRSVKVRNTQGELVQLGDSMGTDASVVIFLRHLAWVYCWTYATEWSAIQPQVSELGTAGPLFVSIGEPEKLAKFLDMNPQVPKDKIFVDDYNFAAYDQLGFGKFGLGREDFTNWNRVQFPKLRGINKWRQYLTSIPTIGPFEEGKYGVPEGGLKLGGTYIVQGSDIVYEWRDKLPGDLPDPKDVVAKLREIALA